MTGNFQLVDADTRRPLRGSRIQSATLALRYLYGRIEESYSTDRDFLILDAHGRPVSASWLRQLATLEQQRAS